MKMQTTHRLYMKEVEKRRKQIKVLRAQRLTWTAIGKALGITRQRAQQIGSK